MTRAAADAAARLAKWVGLQFHQERAAKHRICGGQGLRGALAVLKAEIKLRRALALTPEIEGRGQVGNGNEETS